MLTLASPRPLCLKAGGEEPSSQTRQASLPPALSFLCQHDPMEMQLWKCTFRAATLGADSGHFHRVWLTALLCIPQAGPCLPWDGNLQVVWLTSCKTGPLGQGDKNGKKVQRKLIWEKVGGTWLRLHPDLREQHRNGCGGSCGWLLCAQHCCFPFGMQEHAGVERGTVCELSSAFRSRGIRDGCFPEWDTCLL